MVSTNEFKTGLTVTIDNDPWQVVEFQHVKPGKGAAFVRAKMRNLATGAVVERTFNSGERLPKANIERRIMQYLYESDGNFLFMDNDTYEQLPLTKDDLVNLFNDTGFKNVKFYYPVPNHHCTDYILSDEFLSIVVIL